MHRSIASALILSFAAHVVAGAGYWLWGGDSDHREALPVVEVALVMDASEPALAAEKLAPEPEPETEAVEAPPPPPEPKSFKAPSPPEPRLAEALPPPRATQSRPAPAPVASTPAPQPAPVDPGLIVSVEQAYKTALQAEIARHRSYPRIARRLRQEGTVEVGFVVLADGRLTEIELVDSSGYDLLDHAAIQAVRDVRQFRPIPSELARKRWNLSVPLNFRLL
jgi:protein TonB